VHERNCRLNCGTNIILYQNDYAFEEKINIKFTHNKNNFFTAIPLNAPRMAVAQSLAGPSAAKLSCVTRQAKKRLPARVRKKTGVTRYRNQGLFNS